MCSLNKPKGNCKSKDSGKLPSIPKPFRAPPYFHYFRQLKQIHGTDRVSRFIRNLSKELKQNAEQHQRKIG